MVPALPPESSSVASLPQASEAMLNRAGANLRRWVDDIERSNVGEAFQHAWSWPPVRF
jgi:hypothetical protein